MSERKVNEIKLSTLIADALFELGDEPGSPCYRICFMNEPTAFYNYKEIQQGGLSKNSLIAFLEDIIRIKTKTIKIT